MLKEIVKVVSFIIFLFLISYGNASYKEVSLNGEWDFTFQKGGSDTPELPDITAYIKKAVVPDYLYFQDVGFSKGIGYYRKLVDIPDEWQGKSVQLYIGRAYDRVNVWVNGKHLGFYPYISIVPVLVDLTKEVKAGEKNEIIISVDNTKKLTYKFNILGGIVEPVKLLVSNSSGRIEDLYIRPGKDLKEIVWKVELKNLLKEKVGNSEINWLIKDWKTGRVIGKGVVKVKGFSDDVVIEWTSKHPDIKPWHPDHTNLYLAEVSWGERSKVIDTLSQRFGLRRWSSEGRNLKLNGNPIYLRQLYGTIEQATHWRYPQDKEYWLKYFQLIKDYGYNGVDWSPIASQEALEAADEVGIVIQCGYLFDALEYLRQTFNVKNGATQVPTYIWEDIAKWTRSYPSMCIYILGGEMSYYEGFIEDVCRINKAIKSVNPESMLLPNQAMCGIEYNFAEADKPYLKDGVHIERLEKITKCSDIFGQYPSGGFSYSPFREPWYKINERLAVYQRPLISHEVMESSNASSPYPEDGMVSTLRYGKKPIEGLIYRWGNYPTTKAAVQQRIAKQTKRDWIHYENISHLHNILSKYVFEKIRKCENNAGYQDLNGWGGLNVFLEPSPGSSPEYYSKFNNENVLLLDFDNGNNLNCCYWEKDEFQGKVMLSLYDERPIEKGVLSYELKEGDKVLIKGSFDTGYLPNGKVSVVKDIKFTLPEVSKNSRLNLSMVLSGSGYTIRNDWNFWIFKKKVVPKINAACSHNMYLLLKERYPDVKYLKEGVSEKLWVTDLLNENAINHLKEGGDVLLIGGRPFVLFTRWPTFNAGYRNHHNSGSTIYEHPVFKDIPNEGWGDWQFYPLLEGAATVIFEDKRTGGYGGSVPMIDPKMPIMAEVPFDPILEILHLEKQAKQASIFELKAGQGRLFVTTCVTDMKNPVCVTLLDSILDYMNSAEFKPKSEVKLETLEKLLEPSISVSQNEIMLKLKGFTGGEFTPKYDCFYIMPRDAICLNPGETTKSSFELKEEEIPKTKSNILILSIDGQDCDKPGTTEIEVLLNNNCIFKGINNCIKIGWSIWEIPFNKEYLQAGTNNLEFRNIEEPAPGSHKWFMIAEAKIKAGKEKEMPKYTGKDTVPPIVKLLSNPPVEKFGHQIVGTNETIFTIDAQDNLSGVKEIEFALDANRYIPYTGSFTLGAGRNIPGSRIIKCRCSDYAGNQTTIFTGASEEGKDLEEIHLEIKAK